MFKTTGFSVGGAQENPNQILPDKIYLTLTPNPFKQYIQISYQLNYPAQVNLKVFDLSGREIIELIEGNQNPGCYQITWNGNTDQEQFINPGAYFYRLTIDDRQLSGRIVKIN